MKSVCLLLISVAAMFGQVVPGRYLVELNGDPAAAAVMKEGARFAARDARFTARRAAVRQSQMSARRAIGSRGGTVLDSVDTVMNALLVRIPDAQAATLMAIPGVTAVHPVRWIPAHLDHALPLHRVLDAWAALPQGQNSAGAGIKIAMLDTGIDSTNPAFSATLPPVTGFPQYFSDADAQFTNAKIIVAKNYTTLMPDGGEPDANDRSGHGTGTALAAAGGPAVSPYGPIVGVAPQAYIGNYKVLDANGATLDVIVKAIDDAVADGMDVINLSLGGIVTSYSDTDLRDPGIAAMEAATSAGVIVTVSAGNSGPGSTSLANFANAPDVIAVGAIRNDRLLGYAVTPNGLPSYSAFIGTGANPGQSVSGPLFDVAALDPTSLACSPLPAGSVTGLVVLVMRGTCFFEQKIDNVAAGGAVGAIIYNNGTALPFGNGAQVVGAATLPTLFMSQADGTDLQAKLAAAGSLNITLQFVPIAFSQSSDLTVFSSRGPSVASALKPDLVAVGQDLVTAGQSSFQSGELYTPSGYVYTAGTSYSAPLVAGAAALLKGARPGLTVAQYRSLLINNAIPATSAPGVPAKVSQSGAGVLNAAAALNATVTAFPTGLNFATGGVGSQGTTLNLNLTNVGKAAKTYSISVVPSGTGPTPTLSTNSFQLDPGKSQPVVLGLTAAGASTGEYQGFIQVTGTVNPATISIPYWFAVPGTAAAGISILYQDTHDASGAISAGAIVFRVVDAAGLPFNTIAAPTAHISQGGGTVRNVYRAGTIPGTYAVDLRAGTNNMQVDISVGDITQSVVIPVQ